MPAADAPVVWLPDVEHAAIVARADVRGDASSRNFALATARLRAHLHFDGHGRQIITLDNESCRVTLIVDGALASLGPVRLCVGSVGVSGLADHVYRLNALAHVLIAQRYFGPLRRPGAVDARHLRNSIIALDGERAGASRRQIASVIYGQTAVSQQWNDPSGRLKAMVKRDVLRGRRLVSGGWRDLITAGSFRARA